MDDTNKQGRVTIGRFGKEAIEHPDLARVIATQGKGSVQHRRLCRNYTNLYARSFQEYFSDDNLNPNDTERLHFTNENLNSLIHEVGELDCLTNHMNRYQTVRFIVG